MYGGCRAIIARDQLLLFEPNSPSSRKFLEIVTPRLAASEGARIMREYRSGRNALDADEDVNQPPFELEMVEGALLVATGTSCSSTQAKDLGFRVSCQATLPAGSS